MIRKALKCLVAVAVLLAWTGSAAAVSPEASFKKDHPNISCKSLRRSAIAGLYEVELSDGRVIYYAPATGHVLVGNMITKSGQNLTRQREEAIVVQKVKAIPLDRGLKLGMGPHTVIEFTDPDCPFCRQASKFLASRTDITRYVFFVPLPMHPNAPAKIRYIHCSSDKAKAYEEAMTGKLDEMKFEACKGPAVDKAIKDQEEVVTKTGISSTPIFFIDGTLVQGADIQKMQALLTPPPDAPAAPKNLNVK